VVLAVDGDATTRLECRCDCVGSGRFFDIFGAGYGMNRLQGAMDVAAADSHVNDPGMRVREQDGELVAVQFPGDLVEHHCRRCREAPRRVDRRRTDAVEWLARVETIQVDPPPAGVDDRAHRFRTGGDIAEAHVSSPPPSAGPVRLMPRQISHQLC
jgi:hypothetical protein